VEDEREEASTTACARAARGVQAAIMAYFALAAASLVTIYIVAPDVYTQVLPNGGAAKGAHPLVATALMVAILVLVAALTLGVLRQWRWVFWDMLAAFGFSALQIPAGALELARIIPSGFRAGIRCSARCWWCRRWRLRWRCRGYGAGAACGAGEQGSAEAGGGRDSGSHLARPHSLD
jgi:hypothetical protein